MFVRTLKFGGDTDGKQAVGGGAMSFLRRGRTDLAVDGEAVELLKGVDGLCRDPLRIRDCDGMPKSIIDGSARKAKRVRPRDRTSVGVRGGRAAAAPHR